MWFSDEVHFLLCGQVNRINHVFWGTQAPDQVFQKPLHSTKCTAWIAISKHGIIGPFRFEDEKGKTTTVAKERYIENLKTFYTRLRTCGGINEEIQWFH